MKGAETAAAFSAPLCFFALLAFLPLHVCAYWKFDRLTNAASEGFNNKIRHLIAQAYGYRDYEYLKLKVYELPSMELTKRMLSFYPK
jgi:hypothetical protein